MGSHGIKDRVAIVGMGCTPFAEHWDKSLDRWFEQGVDTPGLAMIEVEAKRIHYWDGEDEGEVRLPARAEA